MALKAKNPAVVQASKPKFMISGESGCGKTLFSLQFPKPYLIDCESGATRPQYQERLKAAGGVYFGKEEGSQDFDTVLEEVKALATEPHDFKTLIIDSFSYLYLLEAATAELTLGSDFGRDKKEANKPTRQLIRWLEKIDMNVILICHSKANWVRKGKDIYQDGFTFDGYDKLEYILDLWIEIPKGGKTFLIKKSRVDSLKQGDSKPLTYDAFADLYGKEAIESAATPASLATPEQVARLKELVEILNVDMKTINEWFKKCDVEAVEEMTGKQIQSLIDYLTKKIETVASTKEVKKEKK